MDEHDRSTPELTAVQAAYESWAEAYIDRFGSADAASAGDRALIAGWSDGLAGPVLDAGCGPGHWSAFLHARGLEVEGVDATPAFVAHAARANPGIVFRHGDLRGLALPDGALGGVLAWFSLIHIDPQEVPAVLQRFARALRPGGGLLLGFFSGARLQPFDHRVVTAWAWPVASMRAAVEAAGLRVGTTGQQEAPNGRITAHLTARRPG